MDVMGEHHRGLQSQQGDVPAPLSRQAVVELGVSDDLLHLCQLVTVIESQLPDLDPDVISLQVFFPWGRGDRSFSEEAGGRGLACPAAGIRLAAGRDVALPAAQRPAPCPLPTTPLCPPPPLPLAKGAAG